MMSVVWVSSFAQVPLSACSAICPPGTRKAIKPNVPICCHDCVACAAGQVSNQTGERKPFAYIMFKSMSNFVKVL